MVNDSQHITSEASGNQTLTIKHWRDLRKNTISRTLLGRDCEVEKMMRYIKDIGVLEEI